MDPFERGEVGWAFRQQRLDAPSPVVAHRHVDRIHVAEAIEVVVGGHDHALGWVENAGELLGLGEASPVPLGIPSRHRNEAGGTLGTHREQTRHLVGDSTGRVGGHPVPRRLDPTEDPLEVFDVAGSPHLGHRVQGRGTGFSGRPPRGEVQPLRVRIAVEHAVHVLVEDDVDRISLLHEDPLTALGERHELVVSAECSIAAVLHPGVHRVHERVGRAPPDVAVTPHERSREPGHVRGQHRVIGELDDLFHPDVRQAVHLEVGIVRDECAAGTRVGCGDRPVVRCHHARARGAPLQFFGHDPLAELDPTEQLPVQVQQTSREQRLEPVVIDPGLDHLDEQPLDLGLGLSEGDVPGHAGHEQRVLDGPRLGSVAQQAELPRTRSFQAGVDARAVGIDECARFRREGVDLALGVAGPVHPPEERVDLDGRLDWDRGIRRRDPGPGGVPGPSACRGRVRGSSPCPSTHPRDHRPGCAGSRARPSPT